MAMQLSRTVASFWKRRGAVLSGCDEQGSSSCWSKRDCVPNSSPIEGARKPSAKEARSLKSGIGFQLTPPLKVVVEPEVE